MASFSHAPRWRQARFVRVTHLPIIRREGSLRPAMPGSSMPNANALTTTDLLEPRFQCGDIVSRQLPAFCAINNQR